MANTLSDALDRGFDALSLDEEFDEDLITSAMRAAIELKFLGLLEDDLAAMVLHRVRDCRFKPTGWQCHGAYVGMLGTLAVDIAEPGLGSDVVSEILDIANYCRPNVAAESVFYEALWALNTIIDSQLSNADAVQRCIKLAEVVCKEERYLEREEVSSDAANALREARSLHDRLRKHAPGQQNRQTFF